MNKVIRIDPSNPLKCDHLIVYEWKQKEDGTQVETMKCLYCGAYVVDTERLNRMRDFAWKTFAEEDSDD